MFLKNYHQLQLRSCTSLAFACPQLFYNSRKRVRPSLWPHFGVYSRNIHHNVFYRWSRILDDADHKLFYKQNENESHLLQRDSMESNLVLHRTIGQLCFLFYHTFQNSANSHALVMVSCNC